MLWSKRDVEFTAQNYGRRVAPQLIQNNPLVDLGESLPKTNTPTTEPEVKE